VRRNRNGGVSDAKAADEAVAGLPPPPLLLSVRKLRTGVVVSRGPGGVRGLPLPLLVPHPALLLLLATLAPLPPTVQLLLLLPSHSDAVAMRNSSSACVVEQCDDEAKDSIRSRPPKRGLPWLRLNRWLGCWR